PARFAPVLGERAGSVGRGEQILLASHRRNPRDFAVLMALADHHPSKQRVDADERVGWYRAALAVHPTRFIAWNNLGVALNDRGDAEEALAAYREALRFKPDYAVAHSNLGVALIRARGDRDAALAEFREAVRLDPRNAIAQCNLGRVLTDRADWAGGEAAA